MTMPRIVLPLPLLVMVKPLPETTLAPLITILGALQLAPLWVVPSIVIGVVIFGRGLVRLMVQTPPGHPPILKVMVSAPAVAFALRIACRKVFVPVFPASVTEKVAAAACF